MKKRVYQTNSKRKRLVKDAMVAVRQTRESIDPELLEKAREAIGAAIEKREKRQYKAMQLDRVPVDRKKNLAIVLKFMELQPENKALQQEIRSYLTQH